MDRVQLKMDAKAAMQQANPHPVLVTLVYLVILAAVNFVVSMMSGFSSLFTVLVTDPDAAAVISTGMFIPSLLLSLAATLVIGFMEMGYTAYTLRVVNRQPAGINDLFAYARYCLKIWGLTIVMGIFVMLWSLLFWIPGVIAYYRYSQALYILAENPEKGIMDCINESKAMMYGHKMDKFVLDLSFILWYLLAGVTCGIAGIYVTPYVGVTNAGFYNSLKYGGSYQPNGYGPNYGAYQQGGFQQNGYGFQQGQGGFQQGYGQQGFGNPYQQGYDPNYQQNGNPQGFDPNYQQNGNPQGFDPNYQQNANPQGFDPNYQQNGNPQGFDPNYQQNANSQGFDPNYQQNGTPQDYNTEAGTDTNQPL